MSLELLYSPDGNRASARHPVGTLPQLKLSRQILVYSQLTLILAGKLVALFGGVHLRHN